MKISFCLHLLKLQRPLDFGFGIPLLRLRIPPPLHSQCTTKKSISTIRVVEGKPNWGNDRILQLQELGDTHKEIAVRKQATWFKGFGRQTSTVVKKGLHWISLHQPTAVSPHQLSKSFYSTTSAKKMSGGKLKIVILYGSTRQGRQVTKVGELVKTTVEANGMEAIVLDPLELPFEMLKEPLHFMKDPTKAPQWLQDTNETIKTADGFIFISAEYNCGIPPALANMVDHFPPSSYRHRPVGLVSYSMGQYGGSRVTVVLHPFVAEIGLVSIPTTASIPTVHTAFDDSGKCTNERVSSKVETLVKELQWYSNALKSHKAQNPPPS